MIQMCERSHGLANIFSTHWQHKIDSSTSKSENVTTSLHAAYNYVFVALDARPAGLQVQFYLRHRNQFQQSDA